MLVLFNGVGLSPSDYTVTGTTITLAGTAAGIVEVLYTRTDTFTTTSTNGAFRDDDIVHGGASTLPLVVFGGAGRRHDRRRPGRRHHLRRPRPGPVDRPPTSTRRRSRASPAASTPRSPGRASRRSPATSSATAATATGTDGIARPVGLVVTSTPTVGGRDRITGGAGRDAVLGGVGDDTIDYQRGGQTAPPAGDVVLGDNGFVDWALVDGDHVRPRPRLVRPTRPRRQRHDHHRRGRRRRRRRLRATTSSAPATATTSSSATPAASARRPPTPTAWPSCRSPSASSRRPSPARRRRPHHHRYGRRRDARRHRRRHDRRGRRRQRRARRRRPRRLGRGRARRHAGRRRRDPSDIDRIADLRPGRGRRRRDQHRRGRRHRARRRRRRHDRAGDGRNASSATTAWRSRPRPGSAPRRPPDDARPAHHDRLRQSAAPTASPAARATTWLLGGIGGDTIDAGDGANVVFGDHGVVVQDVAGCPHLGSRRVRRRAVPTSGIRPQRLQTTTTRVTAELDPANGARRHVTTAPATTSSSAARGGDTIGRGAGNDLVFGDFARRHQDRHGRTDGADLGSIARPGGRSRPLAELRLRRSTPGGNGGDDLIDARRRRRHPPRRPGHATPVRRGRRRRHHRRAQRARAARTAATGSTAAPATTSSPVTTPSCCAHRPAPTAASHPDRRALRTPTVGELVGQFRRAAAPRDPQTERLAPTTCSTTAQHDPSGAHCVLRRRLLRRGPTTTLFGELRQRRGRRRRRADHLRPARRRRPADASAA